MKCEQTNGPVFDYRGLRLLMGLTAFCIPIIVLLWSRQWLTSISASYHTDAQDIFVGLLFVVGSFLLAYNGHSICESIASRVAALAAFLVALFPTYCDTCSPGFESNIHYIAAAALFLILAYFCFLPFRRDIKGAGGKKRRRSRIYLACGWTMIICIAAIAVAKWTLEPDVVRDWRVVLAGEWVALWAFAVAWITSGKALTFIADENERYHPLR